MSSTNDLINYSFYFDFLEKFKSITYNGFPLVYLFNIHPIYNLMNRPVNIKYKQEFENTFKTKLTEKEIQPTFDQIIESIKKPQSTNKNGKIILYDELNLRFTDNVYLEYFDPTTTIIVRTVSNDHSFLGIPIHSLENRKTNNKQRIIEEVKTKADVIFLSNKGHPFFSIPDFQARFYAGMGLVIEWIDAIIDFFEKTPISCVVTGGSADHISRMLILIGASKGIPSVCLQHAMIAENRGWVPTIATKEAVYSYYEKEFLMSWGVPVDRIEITGHPKYDRIFTRNHMSKADFSKITGLPPSLKTVLIATQPALWNINHIQEIIHYLKPYNIGVIIKPHPSEIKIGTFLAYEILKLYNELVEVIVSELNLYDVLKNIDVVCVGFSTVGLEAALLGKPVVYTSNKPHDGADYPYTKYLTEPNIEKLAYILKELITNEKYTKKVQTQQKKLVSQAYPQQLAGKHLSDLIYTLTGIRSYLSINGLSEGMVIKGSDENMYILKDNMKRHILNPEVFNRLGLDWNNVHIMDDDIIKKIPSGLIIS